jgi:hypothetical protein
MGNYKWLAKMGGIVAIAAILFLPMAGCGSYAVTGIDILESKGIGVIDKMFLVISLICAASAIFLKAAIPILASGIVGLIALAISYLIAKNAALVPIELKSGAYFAIVSFIIILISGFLQLGTNVFGERILRFMNSGPITKIIKYRKENHMLWLISAILIFLWLLGLVSSYTMGGYIHAILMIAIIVILVNVIRGPKRRGEYY